MNGTVTPTLAHSPTGDYVRGLPSPAALAFCLVDPREVACAWPKERDDERRIPVCTCPTWEKKKPNPKLQQFPLFSAKGLGKAPWGPWQARHQWVTVMPASLAEFQTPDVLPA